MFQHFTEFQMTTSYFYSIIHLIQGGSCADRGLASFTNTELEGVAWLIDDIEGLKEKPTVKLFFKLFTPAVYQYIEENSNKLPRYWLSGLNSSLTSITVCHEKMKDTFAYTEGLLACHTSQKHKKSIFRSIPFLVRPLWVDVASERGS